MIYSIRLTITHHYNQPAANSRHLIRVLPINILGRQRLARHLLDISPEPDARSDALDFFGNMATTCAHSDQHGEMSIRLACHVEVFRPQPWLDISPSVANLRHQWGRTLPWARDHRCTFWDQRLGWYRIARSHNMFKASLTHSSLQLPT